MSNRYLKILIITTGIASILLATSLLQNKDIDFFIIAGQSNAMGYYGDARYFPIDNDRIDKTIKFYWSIPFYYSCGKWITLQPQSYRFLTGLFGPEITFARLLKKNGYNPAIFKYTKHGTSIEEDWKGPGDGKLYDRMVYELLKALYLLNKDGFKIKSFCFIWIQGESDALSPKMESAYKNNLRLIIDDLCNKVLKKPEMPIILAVNEMTAWVSRSSPVVKAQQELAAENKNIIWITMIGLEQYDFAHLSPKGHADQGKRIFENYIDLVNCNK